jgi:transcription elongation factor Elf1
MIKSLEKASDIKETDIIFDCPNCGKSLAIDYRGAGLTIKCSDCGSDVQVPIPDGMELEDLDSPVEDQEIRIIQLRRSLQNAQERISILENAVEDLMQRRDALERDRSQQTLKVGEILEKIGLIETSLKDAFRSLEDVAGLCRHERADQPSA